MKQIKLLEKYQVSQGAWKFLGSAVAVSRFYLLPLSPSLSAFLKPLMVQVQGTTSQSLLHWAHTSPHSHLTRGHFYSLGHQEEHMYYRRQVNCPMTPLDTSVSLERTACQVLFWDDTVSIFLPSICFPLLSHQHGEFSSSRFNPLS